MAVRISGPGHGVFDESKLDAGFGTFHQVLDKFCRAYPNESGMGSELRLRVHAMVSTLGDRSLDMDSRGMEFLFRHVRDLHLSSSFVRPTIKKKTIALPRGLYIRKRKRFVLKVARRVERGADNAELLPPATRLVAKIESGDGVGSESAGSGGGSASEFPESGQGSVSESSSSSSSASESMPGSPSSSSSSSSSSTSSRSPSLPAPVSVPVAMSGSTYFSLHIGVPFPALDRCRSHRSDCKHCGNRIKFGEMRIGWSFSKSRPQGYLHVACLVRKVGRTDSPYAVATRALDEEQKVVMIDLIRTLRASFSA
jgi:hypothetical protein